MKTFWSLFAVAIAAATFAVPAAAQIPAAGGRPAAGDRAKPKDCAKAKDRARCEALNKQIEACRDKTDDAWRECMHLPAAVAKFTPPKPRDCAKAKNKKRCEAHTRALKACEQMSTRAAHRRCMAEQLPQPAANRD